MSPCSPPLSVTRPTAAVENSSIKHFVARGTVLSGGQKISQPGRKTGICSVNCSKFKSGLLLAFLLCKFSATVD